MFSAGDIDHALRAKTGGGYLSVRNLLGRDDEPKILTLFNRAQASLPIVGRDGLPSANEVVEVAGLSVNEIPHTVVLLDASKGVSILIPKDGAEGGVKVKKGEPKFLGSASTDGKSQKVFVVDLKSGEKSFEEMLVENFAPAVFKDLNRVEPSGSMNLSGIAQIASGTTDIPAIVAQADAIAHSPAIMRGISSQDGKTNRGLQHGLGFVSIGGIGTGFLRYITGSNQLAAAKRIHDVGGAQIANIRRARGVFEVGYAVVAGTLQTLNTPQLMTAARVSHVALKVLSKLAAGLGVVYGLLVTVPIVWNGIKSSNFISDLKAVREAEGTREEKAFNGLTHLMNQLVLSEDEKDAVKGIVPNDSAKFYEMISEKVVLHEDENEILTTDDRDEIKRHLDAIFDGLENLDDSHLVSNWGQVRENLAVRLMKGWAHHKMVRRAKYLRRASGKSYELLKRELARPEEYRLVQRLTQPGMLIKAEEIMDIALSEAHANIKIAVIVGVICLLSLISVALVNIASGGAPIAAALVLSLLSTLIGTGLDINAFINEIQQMRDSGAKDRMIILAFAAVTLLAMVVGAIEAGGVIPLVVVIVGGAIMMSMHTAAIVASFKAEQEAIKRRQEEAFEREYLNGYTLKDLEMFE